MKIQNSKSKGGFSLLEIMVVVAIISIMSGSVVIGFNSFSETVRTRETAGVITDTLRNMELEMVRRDYVRQTINFEKNYLVAEAGVEGQNLSLEWSGPGPGDGCAAGEERLKIVNPTPGSPVYLAKRDRHDNNLQIDAVTEAGKTICVKFLDSEETEWRYQLFSGNLRSQIIRFIHFNIRRGDPSSQVTIDDNDYTLRISSPYGSKTFYNGNSRETGPVALTVRNGGGPETITLQE